MGCEKKQLQHGEIGDKMDSMNVFDTKWDAHAKTLGNLKVLENLSSSSSDGELLKWQVMDEQGEVWWLKSSSIIDSEEMYECEAECIACRIAQKLGIAGVVKYDIDVLEIDGKKYKVCVSKDFVKAKEFETFAELVPDAVHLFGEEKYICICEKLPDCVQQLNKILVFDALIYNRD